MTLTPDRARRFAINVRIPGWARNEPVPSDLYRFARRNRRAARDRSRQRPGRSDDARQGLRAINRTWTAGDTIALNLPMPVRRVVAHEQVIADRDRVALQRGPIVYAAEWPDNPNGKVRNIVLPDRQRADHRVPARSAERRAGDPRPRVRPRVRREGSGAEEPSSRSWRFPTRPGRIAAAGRWRSGWRAPTPRRGRRRIRPRDHRDDRRLAAAERPRQERRAT